ncbi:MAG: LuxR C-terminal-related transcriptional regulator, partial [Muribaculaceae bacterium]|nr:LuxR C-terminal-related transcriptional regulator [Muribaculaceae bacterium]
CRVGSDMFIRDRLIESIDCSDPDGLGFLIVRFYDEYAAEVRNHMNGENMKVFPYVESLLSGTLPDDYNISRFAAHHTHIAPKLQELKDIIVRYYPGKNNDLLNSVLFDIMMCERDLHTHCLVEDQMFVPAVKMQERAARDTARKTPHDAMADNPPTSDMAKIAELSAREKEVVCLIAKGLTNKEIADRLYLSVHTVTTHRRNICNKLEIHSPAGITIFAIVNRLIPLEEIPRPR